MYSQPEMNFIKIAASDEEILRCYPVMAELRPHFTAAEFVSQVKRQMDDSGFRLAYLEERGEIKAVGTLRLGEWLAAGRYCEIEDLVGDAGERNKGYGGRLFDWIARYARAEGCEQLKLVSSVNRFDAHRFYLNKGMKIEAHYFSMPLPNPEGEQDEQRDRTYRIDAA
jgi:GNAT superfamily N-acetyltransferase